MPTLSGFINDRRALDVKYHDQVLKVVYRPSAYNQEWAKRVGAAADKEDVTAIESMADSLAAALMGWDIVDDDGAPVAPTAAVLCELGIGWMSAIDAAITDDLLPNRQRPSRR